MTTPPPSYPPPPGYPPPPSYSQPAYAPPAKQKNTLGLIALIVAIVGFIFACIPGALIIGWVLLPLAFILGIVGLFLVGKSKGTSIAAVVVSVVGVVVGVVVFMTVVSDAVDDAFGGSDLSPTATAPTETDGGAVASADSGDGGRGSRDSPLPIGETVTNDEWTVTLGQPREAGAEIAAENQFNDAPDAGMQFWIVPVTATYTGDDTGSPTYGISVKFVGSDNRTYSDACGVIPDPLTDIGELYGGGVAEGNACVAVPAGADGLWTLTAGLLGDPVFLKAE